MSNSQDVVGSSGAPGWSLAQGMVGDVAPSTGDKLAGNAMSRDEQNASGRDPAAFLKGASHYVRSISGSLRTLCQTPDVTQRRELLAEIQHQTNSMRTLFSSGNMSVLSSFASSLGRLMAVLKDAPQSPNPSVLRTITNALDFLRVAMEGGCHCRETEKIPLKVMVVDDDAVCRRAMALALSSGDLRLMVCENGVKAMESLRDEQFDVIFLDIMMPGVNGLALARTIRELPANRQTPVVFVTCLSDFKTRSETILSGGCDFIAKPVFPAEVVVKAYTLALRKRFSVGEFTNPAKKPAPAGTPKPVPPCVGVIHISKEGKIESYDQDCTRLLGFEAASARGQSIEALFPKELQISPDAVTRILTEDCQRPWKTSLRARRKDGSVGTYEVTVGAFGGKSSRMLSLKPEANATDATPGALASSSIVSVPEPAIGSSPEPAFTAPAVPAASAPAPTTAGGKTVPPALVASLEERLAAATEALTASRMALNSALVSVRGSEQVLAELRKEIARLGES